MFHSSSARARELGGRSRNSRPSPRTGSDLPGSRVAASLVALALPLCACHTFAPVSPGELSAGVGMRARLSASVADSLETASSGEFRGARTIEGTVVGLDAAEIVVEVPVTRDFVGMRPVDLNQRVRLPVEELELVEIRRLNVFRTGILVGGVGAGLGTVVASGLFGSFGGSSLPGTGQPVEDGRGLIPFRIRIPLGIGAGW